MICVMCGRSMDIIEEPTTIESMAIGLPTGVKGVVGMTIVHVYMCGDCSDKLLTGLQKTRQEAAQARQATRLSALADSSGEAASDDDYNHR